MTPIIWSSYVKCEECGAEYGLCCRDEYDNIATVVCAGRRRKKTTTRKKEMPCSVCGELLLRNQSSQTACCASKECKVKYQHASVKGSRNVTRLCTCCEKEVQRSYRDLFVSCGADKCNSLCHNLSKVRLRSVKYGKMRIKQY